MRILTSYVGILALAFAVTAPDALAQRGVGEPTGVAQQLQKPPVVSLAGTVQGVVIGPCESTTGRAVLGAHFLLKTAEGKTLNIHLGPAAAVDFAAKRLSVDMAVTVKAFRTVRMPKNHYAAMSLKLGGTTIRLRDENYRPVWAAGRIGYGRGYGRAYRPGRGW